MNNNPSELSNEDLEKDMEERNAESGKVAAPEQGEDETTLPVEETMDMGIEFEPKKEQDLDDLLHQQGELKHTGNIPDPEELKFRESQ